MKTYNEILKFKKKYSSTLGFRIKKHCDVLEKHINKDENVRYIFFGQKNNKAIALPNTFVVALTNKRLLFARKRLLFGYFFYAVTPDMFNDLKVTSGIIWGKIVIDTAKELVTISNISNEALDEIETEITEYMMEEKKKYSIKKDS